jgi:hypothetical protein
MDMHAAALPPHRPHISAAERAHPEFALYQRHLSDCSRLMIQADEFADWLGHRAAEAVRAAGATHQQYPVFMAWMRANQGGARHCPAGCFPANFEFWLGGGRW